MPREEGYSPEAEPEPRHAYRYPGWISEIERKLQQINGATGLPKFRY
jgi:hypothetical protein